MLSIRNQRDFQWSKSINNHRTRGEGKQPCAPMWCPGWPSVVMHEHLLPATCHGDGGVGKKWRMHRTSLRIWPALSLHCNPKAVRAALWRPDCMNRKGCWWPLVVGRHDFAGRFFIAQGSRKDKRSLIWFQYWQGSHDRCPWREGTKAGWRCLRAVLPIATPAPNSCAGERADSGKAVATSLRVRKEGTLPPSPACWSHSRAKKD